MFSHLKWCWMTDDCSLYLLILCHILLYSQYIQFLPHTFTPSVPRPSYMPSPHPSIIPQQEKWTALQRVQWDSYWAIEYQRCLQVAKTAFGVGSIPSRSTDLFHESFILCQGVSALQGTWPQFGELKVFLDGISPPPSPLTTNLSTTLHHLTIIQHPPLFPPLHHHQIPSTTHHHPNLLTSLFYPQPSIIPNNPLVPSSP